MHIRSHFPEENHFESGSLVVLDRAVLMEINGNATAHSDV